MKKLQVWVRKYWANGILFYFYDLNILKWAAGFLPIGKFQTMSQWDFEGVSFWSRAHMVRFSLRLIIVHAG